MKYDELIRMPLFCSGENKAEREEEEKGKDEQENVVGGEKSEKKKNSYKWPRTRSGK